MTRLAIPIFDYPHPKNFLINFYFMWHCINMQKIRLFYWFALEISLIKKPCNLIGWENFCPYLRNKIFPKYEISAGTNIKKKLMNKFFNKFNKSCFWPIFGPFSQFSGQIIFFRKSCSATHKFIWFSSTKPKFRKN